ncbi:MAG: glycosyltransferase [Moorellales bacterium]
MDNGFPELDLRHLKRLTDRTGIIQHAVHALPNYQTGYTTDDNARALLAAFQAYQQRQEPEVLGLAETYLGFLNYAQRADGKWHNFVDYTRCFLDEEGSEDSFGRALWAVGYVAAAAPEHYLGRAARDMLERALPWVPRLTYPRAKAFALLGLGYYYSLVPSDQVRDLVRMLADWFPTALKREETREWCWFEPFLTYSNAILPAALVMAYLVTQHRPYWQAATRALEFLTSLHLANGHLKLVGNKGWYFKNRRPAPFDEQPEDAGCLVLAYTMAYLASREPSYRQLAEKCFRWFLGQNELGVPLYDRESGGCFDGLTPEGVNPNRGAESLLAYLLSRLAVDGLNRAEQGEEQVGIPLAVPG